LASAPPGASDASSTPVRAANCADTVPNWVTRAVELVFFKASRNASAASRTSSTAWDELIDPEASRTRVTSTPQDSSIGGFGTGAVCAETRVDVGGMSATAVRAATAKAPPITPTARRVFTSTPLSPYEAES
jgi:hypothetical protein